jgi:hypothetical protein
MGIWTVRRQCARCRAKRFDLVESQTHGKVVSWYFRSKNGGNDLVAVLDLDVLKGEADTQELHRGLDGRFSTKYDEEKFVWETG